MDHPPKGRPPRIPPRGRVGVFALTPLVFAYGVWAMVSGRIGRGPSPIEGTPAIILGGVIAAFAVALFGIAWSERGSGEGGREG
jgi:hypothetical protein